MSETSGSPPKTTRRKSLSIVADAVDSGSSSDSRPESPFIPSVEVVAMYNKVRATLDKDFAQVSDAFYDEIKHARDPGFSLAAVLTEVKKKAQVIYMCASKTCELVCGVPASHPIVVRAFMVGVADLFTITWKVLYPADDISVVTTVCERMLQRSSELLPAGIGSVDKVIDDCGGRLGLIMSEETLAETPKGRPRTPSPVSPGLVHLEQEGVVFVKLAEERKMDSPHSRQALIDQARVLQEMMSQRKIHMEWMRNRGAFTQGVDNQ